MLEKKGDIFVYKPPKLTANQIHELKKLPVENLAFSHLMSYACLMMPGYKVAPHNVLLAEHLMAVERGEITRLMIFLPPRHGKTSMASELFPSWYLGRNPNKQIIATTYSHDRATDTGRVVRSYVTDDLYDRIFPGSIPASDSKSANKLGFVKGGTYYSVGVGGAIVGRGAHCLASGTTILTDNQPLRIEALCAMNPEDRPRVLSFDHKTNEKSYQPILATRKLDSNEIFFIDIDKHERTLATSDHRFFVPDSGYVFAKDLRVGTKLLDSYGREVRVRKTENCAASIPVYDIQVAKNENFYANGILAHNCFLIDDPIKPLAADTPVATPTGWSTMGGLKVGDQVFDHAGKPCNVIAKTPLYKAPKCRVRFSDGSYVDAHPDHLWRILKPNRKATLDWWKDEYSYQVCTKDLGLINNEIPIPSFKKGVWLYRYIIDVEILEPTDHLCITVDSPSHLFLAGRAMVPTCNSREEAESEVVQRKLRNWYRSVAFTRLMPGKSSIIIILTRWSFYDLPGWLLQEHKHEGWVVLELPAVADSETDAIGRKIGEPLWPSEYPLPRLEAIKRTVGTREWNSQYQQKPLPEEGGMVNLSWFKSYSPKDIFDIAVNTSKYFHQEPKPDHGPKPGKNVFMRISDYPRFFVKLICSWDTAFKATELSDPSACTIWGVTNDNQYYLLWVFNKPIEFPELVVRAKTMWLRNYEKYDIPKPRSQILIEDKASGQSLIQELKRSTDAVVIPYLPQGDKKIRFSTVTNVIQAGRVWVPESSPWLVDYQTQIAQFPLGKHDDMVDSTSQFLDYMTKPKPKLGSRVKFWK